MMKVPDSTEGKWAVRLGIVVVASVALSLFVAFAIGGDPAVIEGSLLLAIPVGVLNITLNLAGLLSFVLGVYAVVKYREWLVCKYLTVLYGLAFMMFLLGEFLFPH